MDWIFFEVFGCLGVVGELFSLFVLRFLWVGVWDVFIFVSWFLVVLVFVVSFEIDLVVFVMFFVSGEIVVVIVFVRIFGLS